MNQEDDYETLELIAQLQLMDLEEMRSGLKGKGRAGGILSDAELTYSAMEAEAHAMLQFIRDHRIAKGAERAGREDAELINAIAEMEAQEQADRQYALASANNPNAPPPASTAFRSAPLRGFGFGASHRRSESPSPSSSTSSPLRSGAGSPFSFVGSTSTRSSVKSSPTTSSPTYQGSTGAQRFIPSILRLPSGTKSVECIICSDSTTQAYHAPCGCFYDRDCLTELFNKATVDESLFPPRCCNQHIPFADVRTIFTPQLIQKFEKKAEEFKTPNRLYCHNPSCSTFLGPAASTEREKINRQCTQCYRTTCSFCKNAAHASYVPCETDTAAQQVLALGRQEGWQSCPSCHHMVELDTGCYHMTCRCRHEFCYLCAQQWKNCTCPQWDENRLLAQAERRVARDLGALPAVARPIQVAARHREIARVADNLRQNHDCTHHNFGFFRRGGSGNCESCGHWLRDFLLQCRGCSIRVCVRCQRNRL